VRSFAQSLLQMSFVYAICENDCSAVCRSFTQGYILSTVISEVLLKMLCSQYINELHKRTFGYST